MADRTILLGGLAHETNTFATSPTDRAAFQRQAEYFDEELTTALTGTNSEFAGVLDRAAAADVDVEVIPTLYARAEPGSRVEQETFEFYERELLERIEEHAAEIDGIVLVLHGAMVTDAHDDAEGVLLEAVRSVVGDDLPLVATLDLHTNVSEAMAEFADALVSYETYPHVDSYETGEAGFEILTRLLDEGIETEHTIERPPLIAYPPKQNTTDPVMGEIMDRARAIEDRDDVLKVNVNAGFMQSDVPFMGFTVVTVREADATSDADAATRDLAQYIWNRRDDLVEAYPTPTEAVETAGELIEQGRSPVVLADTGDNPGSGGAADGTTVLRAILEADDCGAYDAGLALIRDPEVVDAALEAGVGETVAVDLGGKTDDLHGEPIRDLECYVAACTDGQFRNRGPMNTGVEVNLGRTALLRCGTDRAVRVVVTENRVQPHDREIWRHVGVRPSDLDLIAVKSKNHYRADYDELAAAVIPLDTPGAGAIDPTHFEFESIPRPKYPLDPETDIEYAPGE